MTRTAAALRRLVRPHVRARVFALVLASAGAVFALAAFGITAAPRLAGVVAAWIAILVVLAVGVWLARWVWRAAEPARIAALVERTTAMRPGSMASRVAPPGAAGAASPELFHAADEQGSQAIERSSRTVQRVLQHRSLRDVALGFVAAALGAGIFLIASPDPSGAAVFWDPLGAIRDARSPVRLFVDRAVVPRGDSVTASITVLGSPDALLWTRNPGEPWRSTSIVLGDDGTANRRIGPLSADLHLRVTSGGRTSRTLTVNVTNPPFLAELALTARFPSYLRRGDEPVMAGPDTVLLPAGTTILTRGSASASLTSAEWSREPDHSVTLDVRGSAFEGRLTPQASGAWRLSLSGSAGPLEGESPVLMVRLIPDSAPVVQLPVPGADTVLPVSLRQLLVVDAGDDHGLTQLSLVSRRVSRAGNVGASVTERLTIPPRAGNRALLDVTLDLRERGLLPGDTVRVFAEARDNAPSPRVGRSPEIALRLPTMEELRALARSATRDVLQAAESLTAAQQALGEQARDLAQGRSRDPASPGGARSPAGMTPQSGALPYASRERAEEVARQQADVAARITELRDAVEEIARAARAAGVGDTAFAARLAEVQELLRRAVSPELEARIRELQQALARLDPEATRDALRRLVEAQEELRKELERSRELFQRAAIEGELASLAADAEALRQRQQEWNRTDARRPDRGAAQEERELARLTDSLGQSLERLRSEIESGTQPGRVSRSRDAARRAEAAMQQAADAAQSSDAQGAQGHGDRAARELEAVPEALEAARDSLAGAWRRETMEALERALAETAVLAERQEEVLDALKRGEAGSSTRARQAALEEGSRAVARQIREAASRNALVPPALERALAYTEHQMRAARQQLEQGNPVAATAEPLAREALEGLNATVLAIARSRAEVSGARSGSGLQEAIEQLARLAGQQQGLNSESQGMMPMMGQGGEAALMQQMRALAARQRALAEQLERLQAGGMSGAAGPLADEARDLARRLERGSLDQATIERQERLYRRLLDAGRTLSGEEPDEGKERVSRSATDTIRPGDAGRSGTAFDGGTRLRYPTWEELRGLSAEERRLVLEYFRRLNEPR